MNSSIYHFKQKFIGDRNFYSNVLVLVIPMILQNLVTNFVSLLDNIMVGQIGTEQMSGVSIVNQYIFIFNITVFGAVSGPGIFGAQFYGKGDHEGHRFTFRFRLLICTIIAAAGCILFALLRDPMISLFLSPDDAPAIREATLGYGRTYLTIMIWSLLPFGLGQAYSSAVRECGETRVPMYASMSAVGVNLILDYGLIFGKLGLPQMGVAGAALATVIAKTIEAVILIVWTHRHTEKNKYAKDVFKNFIIPTTLMINMIKKGTPLLLNEFLWSIGMSIIAQSYSIRGLNVVAARNIAGTMINLFNVIFIQLGACIAIMVGPKLGAGRLAEARDLDNKLLFFSISSTVVLGLCILPLARLFPNLYNTEEDIRSLSTVCIVIQALAMPLWSFTHCCYFTLRSGGKTGLTFLFDFCFSWVIMIPLAFFLSYFTTLSIQVIYVIVTFSEIFKAILGFFLVRSDVWLNNIVSEPDTP